MSSAVIHQQQLLSVDIHQANDQIAYAMDKVLSLGGEGLVFRKPSSIWLPERTHNCLKLKPYFDAEATVIGYVSGRKTTKGSKLRGLMGALVVSYKDKIFELSGFTNHERRLTHEMDEDYGFDYAWQNPGETLPKTISAIDFPLGSVVTFKYRELSKSGIPIEASYFRKHLE
jgi:ATP-dependent DNA ligase